LNTARTHRRNQCTLKIRRVKTLVFNESVNDAQFRSGGTWEIDHGWDVFGADGEKVGDVHEVQPHYIVVSKGFFFPTERYVPVSAITNVEHDRVYLNVSKDQIDSMGWDAAPDFDMVDDTTTTSGTTRTNFTDTVPAGYYDTTNAAATEVDELRVPLAEEQLDVRTREVERGRVRVQKDVVEEVESVNVPLREEEVHIERRAVDAEYSAGDIPADAFRETEIDIPIRGEEVDVSKRAVVREEVDITKTVREREQQVSDTVRREELHIDGDTRDGLLDVDRVDGELFDNDRGRNPR